MLMSLQLLFVFILNVLMIKKNFKLCLQWQNACRNQKIWKWFSHKMLLDKSQGHTILKDKLDVVSEKKKPLHSLLFVLPFAMHSLILAGMSPVVESSGPEEQNSRWNWTLWGLVPPHSYSRSSTVKFNQILCYTRAQMSGWAIILFFSLTPEYVFHGRKKTIYQELNK